MASQVKTTIKIPEQYSKRESLQIASDIVDFIIKRTESGKGKDGKDFPKYSKSYKDSFDFKVAGKSGTVNLTLSGEMLNELQVLMAERGKLEIGFDPDSDVNDRAEGNILGSYGGEPNKSKARNFLALSKTEIANILKDYPLDSNIARLENLEASELARVLANEISEDISFDKGE